MTDLQHQVNEAVLRKMKAQQELVHIEALEASGFFARLEKQLALDFATHATVDAHKMDDNKVIQWAHIYRGACMVITAIMTMKQSHENMIADVDEMQRQRV